MKPLGILVLLLAFDADAQMYKCVDERGVTQYTDKPQAGCKEVAIKPSPPLSGAVRPRQEDLGADETGFRRRQIEREASAAKERQEQMALAARCARLRNEYATLSSGARIVTRNPQGEREFLDDATRESRMARLQQQLRGCP